MRPRLSIGFGGAIALSALASACKSDGTDPAIADVLYEGAGESTALSSMVAAPITDDPNLAARFTWPLDGDPVPPDPAPTFCWEWGQMAEATPPAPFDRGFVTKPAPTPSKAASLGELLLPGWLTATPEAHAADAKPLSGPGYFLVFSTSKNAKVLRVFTTNHDYTPDPAALMKLENAGELIHVVVTTAQFDKDQIAKSGGPFKGIETTFTMMPP
jgi:hypothetical protein